MFDGVVYEEGERVSNKAGSSLIMRSFPLNILVGQEDLNSRPAPFSCDCYFLCAWIWPLLHVFRSIFRVDVSGLLQGQTALRLEHLAN